MDDPIYYLEQELGRQFDDAPRELKATINLAINAIQSMNCGEALNELRRAQQIVDEQLLVSYQAELHTVWALFYRRGCPEFERNVMWHHIAQAQRLEPENKRLLELINKIREEGSRAAS